MGVVSLVVSGATLAGTLLLKKAQERAAIDLQTEASQIQAFDLFNPTTWGSVGANITEVPEAIGAFIRFQAITGLMYFVAIGGTILSAVLIWRETFGGPTITERAFRRAREAAELTPVGQVTEAAKEIAKTVAPREDNPGVSFRKGSRGRAVRDLLAKRIAAEGGASGENSAPLEPFAVATEIVKEEGPSGVAIPEAEIREEMASGR